MVLESRKPVTDIEDVKSRSQMTTARDGKMLVTDKPPLFWDRVRANETEAI
jgi:hypothetical protein